MVVKNHNKRYILLFLFFMMEEKEKRIRALTKLYYSNPKVQEAILKAGIDREVVPRYFEGFGKRPDSIQYASDIMGWVINGATSFHSSEEIWKDPLRLSSEMSQQDMNELRKGWDLIIDIDSQFLDCSKKAAKLIIAALEHHGISNYGIKFSGSKGMHLIVSGKAFPEIYGSKIMKDMFPEWPRAISEYLMNYIRKDYNREVGKILSPSEIAKRTNYTEEELQAVQCLQCGKTAEKGVLLELICPVCGLKIERRDVKISKRRLRCLNSGCAGVLEAGIDKTYYFCKSCKDPIRENFPLSSEKNPELFSKTGEIQAEKIADLDLVLVAPRHLFRMPYSLHEKTALASIVLSKDQIDSFTPRDADPLKVKVSNFYPENKENEGKRLLFSALEWKQAQEKEEHVEVKTTYEDIDVSGITEEMFPESIKKLLRGLEEGKKRGLFILITFLKALKFSNEHISQRVREWNTLNKPPLKEGYVKSQLEWHFRQKRKILPPNYNNSGFYQDLGLLDSKPESKNPVVDAIRAFRKKKF